MGDTLCCQRRSFDRAAPLATSKADRSEHRVQYRANQPDAARLDFATVAAYEDDYFPWEGGGLLGRGTCHANLCDAGEMDRRGYPYHQGFPQESFEDWITAIGGKVKDAIS
jgi:hypothetical protein